MNDEREWKHDRKTDEKEETSLLQMCTHCNCVSSRLLRCFAASNKMQALAHRNAPSNVVRVRCRHSSPAQIMDGRRKGAGMVNAATRKAISAIPLHARRIFNDCIFRTHIT